MSLFSEWNAFSARLSGLAIAVQDEARQSNAPHVSAEHVLWALARMGNESADLLRQLGVLPPPLGSSPRGLGYPTVPYARDTQAALAQLRWRNRDSDLPVLASLIGDGTTEVAVLLAEQSGLDPETLRSRVQAAMDQNPPTGPDPAVDENGENQWDGNVARETPVPPETLWAVVDDPRRQPDWDRRVGPITSVENERFRGPSVLPGSKPDDEIIFTRSGRDPQRMIEWEIGTSADPGFLERRRIEFRPLPNGGTLLSLSAKLSHSGHPPLLRLIRGAVPGGLDGLADALINAASASAEHR